MRLRIVLPWPGSGLSPNARYGYWAQLRSRQSQAKRDAELIAMRDVLNLEDYIQAFAGCGKLSLSLVFHPPDKRRRDVDNLLASMKAALDGLALALQVDDARFDPVVLTRGAPIRGGEVVVEIGS